MVELVGRDAGTAVGDGDLEPAIAGACRDRYAIAWVGVDDGVADEVAEDLGDPGGVGLEPPLDRLEVKVALAEQGKVTAEVFEEVARARSCVAESADRPRRLRA